MCSVYLGLLVLFLFFVLLQLNFFTSEVEKVRNCLVSCRTSLLWSDLKILFVKYNWEEMWFYYCYCTVLCIYLEIQFVSHQIIV